MELIIFIIACVAVRFMWKMWCSADNSGNAKNTYPSYSAIAQRDNLTQQGTSHETKTPAVHMAKQIKSFCEKWEYKPTQAEMGNLNSREVGIFTNEARRIQCKPIDFIEKHRLIADRLIKCITNIDKLTKGQIVAAGSLFHAYWLAVKTSDFDFIGKANTYIISLLEACDTDEERLELFTHLAKSPTPDMLNH